ncbi:hypothetical protein Psyaliredsea_18030 [Psychrobacter alimentarius]
MFIIPIIAPYMTILGQYERSTFNDQGRNIRQRISAVIPMRNAATPSGPTEGKIVLANAAPICRDIRDANAAVMDNLDIGCIVLCNPYESANLLERYFTVRALTKSFVITSLLAIY